MRKYVSIAITTLFVFAFGFANAQNYTFRVLANKGQNKVKKEGASAPEVLKTGATLSAGDELIASQGAYIGLMHKSGRTLEVRTPGTKKVTDLEKLVNTKTTSVTDRYAQFLADKMEEKDTPGYRARLNATGAVSRALAGDETIQVLVPAEEANVIGNNAVINWDTPEGMELNTFIVTVKNIFDEEIMKEEVTGNAITLDFTSDKMKNEEGLYIVKVAAKENMDVVSGDIGIKRLSGEEAAPYKKGIEDLKSELDADSPLNQLVFASYYEENGLILDAITAIEQAIKMNPEVDDFQIMKKDLIERSGIKVYKEEE